MTTVRKARRGQSNTLTAAETDLQKRRGQYHRKLLTETVADMTKGLHGDPVGLMLSGGVDSTTILWAMLECGIKPHVYTFQMPTTKALSTDAHKASELAAHYGLPFRVATMPSDPEELARIVHDLNDEHHDMDRRADFEVIPTIRQMILEARNRDGVNAMFSGLGDGAIHLLGRAWEIRARTGKMPVGEVEARQSIGQNDYQMGIITRMASTLGVSLALPLLPVTACYPYYGVPWNVMNTPRKKQITIGAWEAEENASGIKAVVAPLQCADSGSREYYDTLIPQSMIAQQVNGGGMNTATPFYNKLRARWFQHEAEPDTQWDWFNWITDPSMPEPPKEVYPHVDRHLGKAKEPHAAQDEDDIFGNLSEDDPSDYMLDPETGKPDTRLDCLGNSFYLGEKEALVKCPRALAGFCGKPHPDVPWAFHKCQAWGTWNEPNSAFLEELAAATSGPVKSGYLAWADKSREAWVAISEDRHQFS